MAAQRRCQRDMSWLLHRLFAHSMIVPSSFMQSRDMHVCLYIDACVHMFSHGCHLLVAAVAGFLSASYWPHGDNSNHQHHISNGGITRQHHQHHIGLMASCKAEQSKGFCLQWLPLQGQKLWTQRCRGGRQKEKQKEKLWTQRCIQPAALVAGIIIMRP